MRKAFFERRNVVASVNSGRGTVLVTGGSGFLGVYCLLQLLKAGYRVRTTVRSLKCEADVRLMLKLGGTEPGDTLTFFAADLNSDSGWLEDGGRSFDISCQQSTKRRCYAYQWQIISCWTMPLGMNYGTSYTLI